MNAIMMLHRAMAGYLAAQGGGGGSKYIEFADQAVLDVLLAKGVSSDGIGITVADAEAVTDIGTWFQGNTEITSFDEFEKFTGVTEIGWDAFNGNTNMTSMKLPESITTLGGRCFNDTPNLVMDIRLPNLSSIDQYSPFRNTGIRSILDLGKMTEIKSWYGANYNFVYNAPNLYLVVIPSSVETIGSRTFRDCPSLATLIVNATTPPSLVAELVYGTTPIPSIYVPDASVDAYKTATNWATYAAKIKPLSEYDPDTVVTFEQGVKLQNSGTTTTDLTMCTTSYMPISNSKSVK